MVAQLLRRIEYVWHSPAFFTPGDAELDILAETLSAGGTGRLYKILVHEKQLAQSVAADQASQQFSSYFAVAVVAKSDADLAEIERIMEQELEKVRNEPITQRVSGYPASTSRISRSIPACLTSI